MGLGCSDESRQNNGKWCALLDGIVAAVWAATPDKTGVTAAGTAALNPDLPTAAILLEVKKYASSAESVERERVTALFQGRP